MAPVHTSAAAGYAVASDVYVRGRPDYPPGLQGWLRSELGLGAGKVAVDLGAGTGKFLTTLKTSDATLVAVEPVAAMLDQLRRAHPDVDARGGDAQQIPIGDASVDAVVCAQAFHWFASAEAVAEIRRVLKPGGMLGLVWNVRDETVPWVAGLTKIMEPYGGDTPRFWTMQWRGLFPASGFSPLVEHSFPHGHTGSAVDVIVSRVMSVSFVAALPQAEQERIEREVRALIAVTPELAGKDRVTFPYVTAAFSCRKTG